MTFQASTLPVGILQKLDFYRAKVSYKGIKNPVVCHLSLGQTGSVFFSVVTCFHVQQSCDQRCRVLHVNTVTLQEWRGCFFKAEEHLMNYLRRRSKHDVRGRSDIGNAERGSTYARSEEHLEVQTFKNEKMYNTCT